MGRGEKTAEAGDKSTGNIVAESSLHLFLIRAGYVLLQIVTKKPTVLILGEPIFGIVVSSMIGFKVGKKVEASGWLCGMIPSVVYFAVSLIRAFVFPTSGVSLPSSIFYSIIYIVAGMIGGLIGSKKK